MLLSEYLASKGARSPTDLSHDARVSPKTIRKLQDDRPIRDYVTALKLSEATRPVPNDKTSGEPAVSVDEICRPQLYAKPKAPRRRAS